MNEDTTYQAVYVQVNLQWWHFLKKPTPLSYPLGFADCLTSYCSDWIPNGCVLGWSLLVWALRLLTYPDTDASYLTGTELLLLLRPVYLEASCSGSVNVQEGNILIFIIKLKGDTLPNITYQATNCSSKDILDIQDCWYFIERQTALIGQLQTICDIARY